MIDFANIPFLQAHPNRYKSLLGMPARPWNWIVIHDMEAPEGANTAENVARWFHTDPMPQSSAHYCVDNDSIVQCVQLRDVAYGAPNANRCGIHIELAGFASQNRAQWLDSYGRAMLQNAADLIAKIIMPKTHIPAVFRDHEALKLGYAGITTHREVSAAFNPGGHQDPGPDFPMDVFLEMIKAGVN